MYCKDIALSTIWIRENNNIFMNGRVLIVECLTDPFPKRSNISRPNMPGGVWFSISELVFVLLNISSRVTNNGTHLQSTLVDHPFTANLWNPKKMMRLIIIFLHAIDAFVECSNVFSFLTQNYGPEWS